MRQRATGVKATAITHEYLLSWCIVIQHSLKIKTINKWGKKKPKPIKVRAEFLKETWGSRNTFSLEGKRKTEAIIAPSFTCLDRWIQTDLSPSISVRFHSAPEFVWGQWKKHHWVNIIFKASGICLSSIHSHNQNLTQYMTKLFWISGSTHLFLIKMTV